MPTFYVSMTASIEAESFEEAHKIADEVVGRIEVHDPYAYDVNHWNVE